MQVEVPVKILKTKIKVGNLSVLKSQEGVGLALGTLTKSQARTARKALHRLGERGLAASPRKTQP